MMTRRHFLIGLLGLLALSAIAYSQPWLTLTMRPNAAPNQLASFDGFALQPWFAVALSFIGLAGLMAIYMTPIVRRVFLAMAAIATSAASLSSAMSAMTGTLGAVQTQLDGAINVAAAHDIMPDQISYDWTAFRFSWIALVFLTAVLVAAFVSCTKWPQRSNIERNNGSNASEEKPADPISLWESQR